MKTKENSFPSDKRRLVFQGILAMLVLAIVVGEPLLLVKPFKKLTGKGLNGRAWRASYLERHLTVPPGGQPREGFWGSKFSPQTKADSQLGDILYERHIPGLFDIDSAGMQYAFSDAHPDIRILIIGGSVAAGAYASNEHRTYFNQLAKRLGRHGHHVAITVQATGGWTSDQELNALRYRGLTMKPDCVLFLDGLNDVTLNRQIPEEERVRRYLAHMREARDLALANGIKVVFSPQPFLPQKREKTGLEMLILAESYRPLDELVKGYTDLRHGLQTLCVPHSAYFMDCSGVFDRPRATVFADIWHFSDFGHARLAEYMAIKLDPIVRDIEDQKGLLTQELALRSPADSPYFHY